MFDEKGYKNCSGCEFVMSLADLVVGERERERVEEETLRDVKNPFKFR